LKNRTKIIATISYEKSDIEFIKSLYSAGMDIVRINTAFQKIEQTQQIIENIRKVSSCIKVLIDTKGPEIRTSEVDEPIKIENAKTYIFKSGKEKTSKNIIYVDYPDFVKVLNLKNRIFIDDGEIEFEVAGKNADSLICKSLNEGTISSFKSVNVPGVKTQLQALTLKDKNFIEFAAKNKINFIAHSFVRNKNDLLEIHAILEKYDFKPVIFAKIENQEGIDNIDEIIENSYGILIARGDLGVETQLEKIPFLQKMIIKKCNTQHKPVIVAAQILHSMINNPRPTRAELCDVANSVIDGADILLLSGETAYGKYAKEAVNIMKKIIFESENQI